jgi:hypothetical protein
LVAASVTYNAATNTATLDPSADLAQGTYTTQLNTMIKDNAGNSLAQVSWSFTTAGAQNTVKPMLWIALLRK